MKKIFAIFIFVIFMPCVSACFAASVGSGCVFDSTDMVDGQSSNVSCGVLKIQNGTDCFVYCDKGNVKQGVRICGNDTFALNPVSGVDGMYEKCGSLKEACESLDSQNSGAKWDDVTKECVCAGNSRSWNKYTMQCDASDEYTKCNAQSANGAKWEPHGGYCWCNDPNKLWDNGRCRERKEKKDCDEIISQLSNPYTGSIVWNEPGQRCECVAGKIAAGGEKIGNPEDYYIGYIYDYNFVDKNGLRQTKRIDATVCYLKPSLRYGADVDLIANSDATRKNRNSIKAAHDKLATISNAWDKSHWKTASGNFNGARLASDSVAGVVLGTVGGVITSNVIKKNQVRGGFEDINCTIGGQRVADYDDQFSVGIQ